MKRLALVLVLVVSVAWTAGNAVLAFSAPVMFRSLTDEAERLHAGTQFGNVLWTWSAIVDVSLWPLSVVLLVGVAFAHRGRRVLLFTLLVLLTATVATHALARQTTHRAVDLLAQRRQHDSDELRVQFGQLHHRNRKLIEAETMVALLTAIGAGVALARRPRSGV